METFKNFVAGKKIEPPVAVSVIRVGVVRASQRLIQRYQPGAVGDSLALLRSRNRLEPVGRGEHQRFRFGVARPGHQNSA
jgi:hypothetical protein